MFRLPGVYLALCFCFLISSVQAQEVLMVVVDGSTGSLSAGDQYIHDQLVALGANVTLIDGTASSATDANGKDLVVISETVSSSTVLAKFKSVAVPVWTSEPAIMDDMSLTGLVGSTDFGAVAGTQVTILDTNFVPGLSGDVTVYTASASLTFGVPSRCTRGINDLFSIIYD